MSYGTRVLCALVGSVMFVVGLALTIDDLVTHRGDLEPNAAICGMGLGLLVAASLRRD